MATGGASGGGYVCSQGLLYGIYAGLLIMHGVINSFGGETWVPPSRCIGHLSYQTMFNSLLCMHSRDEAAQ